MPEPALAHAEAIHITSASGTPLSESTKLEEVNSFSINRSTTTVERMNLNSADGHTRVSATWHALSGSMSGRVIRGSTPQGTLRTAQKTGALAYITVITHASAGAGEEKGERYAAVFESYEETREAGALVEFSASFKVDGAAVPLLGA